MIPTRTSRRTLQSFLSLVVALCAVLVAADQTSAATSCRPTASSGYGPWVESGLGAAPKRSVFGQGYTLTGRVLRAGDCKPLKGVTVEIWQETPGLGYARQGRAMQVTDRNGAFRFVGPRPPVEGGFGAHIHVRVVSASFDEVALTHQVVTGARGGTVTIVVDSSL